MSIAKVNPGNLAQIQWGKGSWQKPEQLTAEQRAWATAPKRLLEQVGLSLKARKNAFNEEFGLGLSIPRFRRLYREAGITKQKMTSRLGGKKLPSEQR